MYVHIDNYIRILESDIPLKTIKKIEADLTLPNPRWEQVENYGRGKRRNFQPEHLFFFWRKSGVLILPRGYISTLKKVLKDTEYSIVDRTRLQSKTDFICRHTLHPYQKRAVEVLSKRRFGVLEAPPGAGKTIIALNLIALRGQAALVIVHTKELMYQWQKRAVEFLGIREEEVGLIGDGKKVIGKDLTIAIINSLNRVIDDIGPLIGNVIVDECHHMPAKTFTEIVSMLDCAYMLGLSATPYRRDRLTKLIYLFLGDRTHVINPRHLQAIDRIMRAKLLLRHTRCKYYFDANEYQYMIAALISDEKRNMIIVDDVIERIDSENNGIALVISDRVAHCRDIHTRLCSQGIRSHLLTGSLPAKKRAEIVEGLNRGEADVLVATSQLIGEGFDLKGLSSIFLATPIRFTGRVKQYIGRILRVAEGKQDALIYDYVDENGILKNSFRSRLYAYRDLGVKLNNIQF